MLAKRYQCALFSPHGRILLSVGLRGWMLLLPPAAMLLLAISGYMLLDYYHQARQARQALAGLAVERVGTNDLLLQSVVELDDMEHSLARMIDFNAKLRIMLDMDSDADRRVTLKPPPRYRRGLKKLPALYGRDLVREIRSKAESLQRDMNVEEAHQQEIARAVSEQLENLATIPVIMPTRGRFSSAFGWRRDPFRGTRRFHKGIDITARTGTHIRAAANGFVTSATRSPSYGLVIVITHSEDIKTRYAHMNGFAVKEGQRVLRGELIGYVGNTGRSKAPHLHYEVYYKGKPVNPRNYILQ